MAKKSVSNTALGAAVCRLIEQYEPAETRLFTDPLIKDLVGTPLRLMMQLGPMRALTVNRTEAVARGIFGAQICRTCFIDETVEAALAKGMRQLAVLGAGYDTRAYRLVGIEQVKVFEVDLPHVQADKKAKVQTHFGRIPANVTFIPIDFDTQTLENVFAGSNFDASKPAMFVWEGVTQYIPEASVHQTLSFIGKAFPGSEIVFTYVLRSIIERRTGNPEAERMMDVVSRSSPWIFGLEPSEVQTFLQPFHLKVMADVGSADYQTRYVQPHHRDLFTTEAERAVHAVVAS